MWLDGPSLAGVHANSFTATSIHGVNNLVFFLQMSFYFNILDLTSGHILHFAPLRVKHIMLR